MFANIATGSNEGRCFKPKSSISQVERVNSRDNHVKKTENSQSSHTSESQANEVQSTGFRDNNPATNTRTQKNTSHQRKNESTTSSPPRLAFHRPMQELLRPSRFATSRMCFLSSHSMFTSVDQKLIRETESENGQHPKNKIKGRQSGTQRHKH